MNPAKQTIIENQLRLKGFVAGRSAKNIEKHTKLFFKGNTNLLIFGNDSWLVDLDDGSIVEGHNEDTLIEYLRSVRHQGPGDYFDMEA